jgi:oligopeptide transport system substrate-binding protein
VYAWRRLLDPGTGSEYAYFLFDVEGAEDYNAGKNKDPESVGIRAISSTQLEVRLRKPVVFFPSLVTFPATFPLRRDVVERFGDRWTEPGNIVTNGPFSLDRWEHEYKIEIVPNPRYFGPRPKLGRVRMFMVRDGATSLTLYETGDLDVTGLMPVAIPSYRNRPDFVNNPVLRGNYVAFNVTKPPLDDPRVRRAFGHAIDRTQIPPILQGGEIAATSWIPVGMFGHEPSIGLRFDPGRARKLLAEAGYPDGGDLPPVTMVYATDPTSRLLAENIQAQWKKNLNAAVAIDNLEWKVFLSRLNADAPQIYRLGWGADYPDPDNFMALWTSGSGNNRTRWKNEAYDRLVARGTEEPEPKRRKAIYDEAQRILLEQDAPIVPVYFSASNRLIHPRVRRFPANPLDLWILKRVSLESQ